MSLHLVQRWHLPDRRHEKLAQLAQEHLDSSKLSPTDAWSFAGKAGFVATYVCWSCGPCGNEAFVCSTTFHATPDYPLVTSSQSVTLYFSPPGRTCGQANHIQHLKNGFGAILFPVSDQPGLLSRRGSVAGPPVFAHRGQFIFLSEALVQVLAQFASPDQLRSPYLSFTYNAAAQLALSKGFSSDDAVNMLSSIFWASAAEKRSAPWFERVSSKANISDGVSRGDFREAGQLGARQLEFDFHNIWDELIRAIRNNKFADSSVGRRVAVIFRQQH